MPELLWKAYIDLEFEERERERTRALYRRLLERTGHVKVWVAFALFEAARMGGDEEDEETGTVEGEEGDVGRAREVFKEGYDSLRQRGLKEEVRCFFSVFIRIGVDEDYRGWCCSKAGRRLRSSMEVRRMLQRSRV